MAVSAGSVLPQVVTHAVHARILTCAIVVSVLLGKRRSQPQEQRLIIQGRVIVSIEGSWAVVWLQDIPSRVLMDQGTYLMLGFGLARVSLVSYRC